MTDRCFSCAHYANRITERLAGYCSAHEYIVIPSLDAGRCFFYLAAADGLSFAPRGPELCEDRAARSAAAVPPSTNRGGKVGIDNENNSFEGSLNV